jgi:acyl-CoA synthetase (AMP-forming)/AMP-acid ligase II
MTLLSCLRRPVQLHPDSPALLEDDRVITYRQFDAGVRRGAARLLAMGLQRGDRVAILMDNSARYLELVFAAATAGLIAVPINTRWIAEDILYALGDCGATMLFVDRRFLAMANVLREQGARVTVGFAGDGECPADLADYRAEESADAAVFPQPEPDDTVLLLYTSGTTGGPKGAMWTHRNAYANAVSSAADGLVDCDPVLHVLPLFHAGSYLVVLPTMLQGRVQTFLRAFSPEAVLETIQRYRIAYPVMVPSMWNMLLSHPGFDQCDLSSVRVAGWGASPMPLPLQEMLIGKFPGRRYFEVYGLTEGGIVIIGDRTAPAVWAGQPACGADVRIFDDDDREVPTGTPGEVVVRSESVMKGYWNRPEINREVLRGGWLHTGDIGSFDEQHRLSVFDRKKDMIKTGGENVFSPEVESRIMEHPAVLEAAVIAVPHEKWIETIRAVVSLRPGARLTEAELIAWCRERMTHFKCPTSVEFLEVLPKTASGKVLKHALRKKAAAAGG